MEEIENKPMPIMQRLRMLESEQGTQSNKKEKVKRIKIPRKAKVRRGKIKKGWIGVIKIDENRNISGEKQKVEDSSLRLKEKTYHSTDGSEIGFWEGKYPVIIQPTWRKNPLKIGMGDDNNETYGQKYVMARMLGDTIKVKTGGGKGILIAIAIGVAGYAAYMLFTGQL